MSISVVIPVGPFPGNTEWLLEAIQSFQHQTLKPTELIIIDDGAHLSREVIWNILWHDLPIPASLNIWKSPWRLGVGHAFNFGVALARNECVFMMGSDDVLHPECLERTWNQYMACGQDDGYYYVPVGYMSDGHVQRDPCNAAMVTKGLWKLTGGFPVEANTAPDAALISIMMVHMPHRLIPVVSKEPLYMYREHADTDTRKHGRYHAEDIIVRTRNILTEEWTPPQWTDRYGI